MANSFLKAQKIAATALGLLQREIILPQLVWRDPAGSFEGAAGDTISLRVPARTTARTRPLRGQRTAASEGNGIIVLDELTEYKVDVTLDEAIYSAVPITDENLTLDIADFATQVLSPQVRAVAEGLEIKVANLMLNATYATTITGLAGGGVGTVYDKMIDARKALNDANVPMNDRIVVIASDLEAAFLKDDQLNQVQLSGSDSALRDATIGRIAGFGQVVVSNALPQGVGFAFHRTAYALSVVAPRVPSGASYGAVQGYQGLGMRWIRDYDFRNVQDRSLLDVFAGANVVADGQSNEVQTVTISGGPTGGTFTLTANGQTTAPIAYNATAAAVRSALNALNGVNVTVSGSNGGPYTVTFQTPGDVAQMTASGSFTGGTSPSVAVATTTDASAFKFVRAVKLTA